jgi:hypothetical protein
MGALAEQGSNARSGEGEGAVQCGRGVLGLGAQRSVGGIMCARPS